MAFEILANTFSLVDNIMTFVVLGTALLGAVFAVILIVFLVKGLRYHHQKKLNAKQKKQIEKAFDKKIEEL